jgi:nifR3 family TIM-barrel protein
VGGVGLCTTDLVNARSLLEKNPRALKLIETSAADSPLAVQLFGSVPEEMRDAAAYLESLGVASVDINMGCPVKKVCQVGGGSAMMTALDKTAALVRGMVNAVKIPVTAKMRLGWDEKSHRPRSGPDGGCGREGNFVHGRTRQQGSVARSAGSIRAVVQAVKVFCNRQWRRHPPQAAKNVRCNGLSGVSIGRGAFYNPWIFRHTLPYLRTGELLPDASFAERVRVMCRHLDLMVEVFGEELGCRMFRKVAPWYAKRFGPANVFNKRVVQVATRAEFLAVLADYIRWRQQFLDERGELLSRFQLPPLVASFMQTDVPAAHREAFVRKGRWVWWWPIELPAVCERCG